MTIEPRFQPLASYVAPVADHCPPGVGVCGDCGHDFGYNLRAHLFNGCAEAQARVRAGFDAQVAAHAA